MTSLNLKSTYSISNCRGGIIVVTWSHSDGYHWKRSRRPPYRLGDMVQITSEFNETVLFKEHMKKILMEKFHLNGQAKDEGRKGRNR